MAITFEKQNDGTDWNYSHKLLDHVDKIGGETVRFFAKHFLSEETIPNFIDIEIETFNRCNNDCAFCPANKNFDTRKPTLMDEELFYSIIEQLRAMDYRGRILCIATTSRSSTGAF